MATPGVIELDTGFLRVSRERDWLSFDRDAWLIYVGRYGPQGGMKAFFALTPPQARELVELILSTMREDGDATKPT